MVNVTDCAHVYVCLLRSNLALAMFIVLVYVEHNSEQNPASTYRLKIKHPFEKQTNKPAFKSFRKSTKLYLELLSRFELETSPLPRECSTTEL